MLHNAELLFLGIGAFSDIKFQFISGTSSANIEMDSSFLQYLLGSVLLAGLLTALFKYFSTRRDHYTSTIISEGTGWRKELKQIYEDLQQSKSYHDLKKQSVKLKALLNPFGANYMPNKATDQELWGFIHQDSYFWELIAYIDHIEFSFSFTNSSLVIESLAEYILILLKADWESRKRQILYSSDFLLYSIVSIPILFFSEFFLQFIMESSSPIPSNMMLLEVILFIFAILSLYLVKTLSSKLARKHRFFSITSFGSYLKTLLVKSDSSVDIDEDKSGRKLRYLSILLRSLAFVILVLLIVGLFEFFRISSLYWKSLSPSIPQDYMTGMLTISIYFLLYLIPTTVWFYRVFRHFERYVLTDYSIRHSIDNVRKKLASELKGFDRAYQDRIEE